MTTADMTPPKDQAPGLVAHCTNCGADMSVIRCAACCPTPFSDAWVSMPPIPATAFGEYTPITIGHFKFEGRKP